MFNPEWWIEVVETELPLLSRKQLHKQAAHSPPETDGAIGKSLKRHIRPKQKIHLDSVTKLR